MAVESELETSRFTHADLINMNEADLVAEFVSVLDATEFESGLQVVGPKRGDQRFIVIEAMRRGLISEFARIEQEYRTHCPGEAKKSKIR